MATCLKVLTVFSALFVATEAGAQQWVELSEAQNGMRTSVDTETVRPYTTAVIGPAYRVWLKYEYARPENGATHSLEELIIDCGDETYSPLGGAAYNRRGEVIESWKASAARKWEGVMPGTVIKTIVQEICYYYAPSPNQRP